MPWLAEEQSVGVVWHKCYFERNTGFQPIHKHMSRLASRASAASRSDCAPAIMDAKSRMVLTMDDVAPVEAVQQAVSTVACGGDAAL